LCRTEGLRRARALIRKYIPEDVRLSDELIAGRRAEAEPCRKAGRIYFQDPATRLAVDLLAPQPGERVLDAQLSFGFTDA